MPTRFVPTDILSSYSALNSLNDNFDEIATLLDLCVMRDGSTPNAMLADLDLNHFSIHNVAEGVADTDATNLGQVRTIVNNTIGAGLFVTPQQFGAVGDGIVNDRAAFVAAVAAARGKTLLIPKGNYLINSDGGSITLEEVRLVGEGVLDGATGTLDQGTTLSITGTTNSPFLLRRGASIEGIGFYYPNQPNSSTPTAYPATLKFDFSNGAIQFVNICRNVVYNAYKFIEIDNGSSGSVGHVEITNNYICALNRAIYLRYNAEHLRIERNNFTFGHWLAATEAGSAGYMRANATALQVDQSDGVEFLDNLIFGYLNGVLSAGVSLCQFMNISSNKFDQVRYPVRAVGPGNFNGAIFGNHFNAINPQNTAVQGRSISIETTGTAREVICIGTNNFGQASEEHLYTTGDNPARDIVVGVNNWLSWASGKASGTYGAINANGAQTNLNVTGGWFLGGNNTSHSYGVAGSFNTLNMSSCVFESCQQALSITVNTLNGSGNASYSTAGTVADGYSTGTRVWGPNQFDKPRDKGPFASTVSLLGDYADDAAAAAAGVQFGGMYRTGNALKIRIA